MMEALLSVNNIYMLERQEDNDDNLFKSTGLKASDVEEEIAVAMQLLKEINNVEEWEILDNAIYDNVVTKIIQKMDTPSTDYFEAIVFSYVLSTMKLKENETLTKAVR